MKHKGVIYTEEYKLDAKDKKIIQVLFENGRYTIAQISKKTGIRRDSVVYRLKKMEKNKVILGFQPIINAPTVGLPNIATILLKTSLSKKEDKEKFIRKVKNLPKIVHMATTIGKYDYQLALIYKDHQDLYNELEKIQLIKPDFITDHEVLQIVDEPKFEDMEGLVMSL